MSYPPNNEGYPPYGNQQQMPPYLGSQQPGMGFTPYPPGDNGQGGGMPQPTFPGHQSNFGNNTSGMPGFNLPPTQGYSSFGGGGGGSGYPSDSGGSGGVGLPFQSSFNASNHHSQPPTPYGSNRNFPHAHGQQQNHAQNHNEQSQQQPYHQPFSGNAMTSASSAYGQQQQQQQSYNTAQNQSSSHSSSSFQPQQQQNYPNLPSAQQNYGSSSTAIMMEPTIRPSQNNPQNDAELVHKAMKGFGTDEKGLVKVLCHRTGQERAAIAKFYKQMYGKELVEALRGECSGKFGDLMVALATPSDFYDAEQIYKAIEGMGTDEDSLVEILCTRTNSEIMALKAAYTYRYQRNVERDIKRDTSGHFERLLVSLLNGGRDESNQVDQNRAAQTAKELYARGEKMFGTDESYFNSVLAAQSLPQIRAVLDAYRQVSNGRELEQSIASEMSGDLRNGMVSLVKCIRNPAVFFAEHLMKSMQGMGTNDHVLIRILVTRCDKDLGAVKREFHRLYKQPLESMIKGDTSGDYEHGLLALCGAA